MLVDDRYITYSSPPHKRKIGRAVAIGAAVALVFVFLSIASNYRTRKAAGYDPLPAANVVMPVAPLIMLGIGMWIGWGHTRVDLRRGVVERRPLGVPWLVKIVRLRDAQRLCVGFYRAPTMISTPNSNTVYSSKNVVPDKALRLWFVRLEGDQMRTMLVVQRGYEEALGFAHEIGDRVDLPVEIEAPSEG